MVSKKKVSKRVRKKKSGKDQGVSEDASSLEGKDEREVIPKKGVRIRKSSLYVFFVVVLLVAALVFVWNLFESDDDVDAIYRFYNGYEFFRSDFSDEVWVTHVRLGDIDQRAEFRHHPLDLEGIPFDSDSNQYVFLSQLADARVFISWSKEIYEDQSVHLSLAGNDLARYFRSFFGFEVRVSVEDSDIYPWVSCDDADINNLVVKVKRGESRVEAEPFCVVLYVDDNRDATKVASLLLYNLFGIME